MCQQIEINLFILFFKTLVNLTMNIAEEKMEDPVPDLPHLKMKDIPAVKTSQNPHLIEQLMSSVLRETKASSGLIFNSFDALEHEPLVRCRNLFSPIPIFPLGPFHKHLPPTIPAPTDPPPDHASIISWLDTNPPKSVLYVCFGTLAAVDRDEFVEIASGLAKCSHPFLWVVRPGMVSGSEWVPEGFDERWARGGGGLVVKWAPQREVLAHPAVGGFWTHSGWNSTIESICEGVPMLCYPFFGDQMANARYVCDVWGIGALLERRQIEKGITRFMAERESGGMMNRIKGFKDMADSCLKQGGSTFLSLQNLVDYILNI